MRGTKYCEVYNNFYEIRVCEVHLKTSMKHTCNSLKNEKNKPHYFVEYRINQENKQKEALIQKEIMSGLTLKMSVGDDAYLKDFHRRRGRSAASGRPSGESSSAPASACADPATLRRQPAGAPS